MYKDRLSFCKLGNFKGHIIYNKKMGMDAAMRCSYELGCRDVIKEIGIHVHEVRQLLDHIKNYVLAFLR